MKTFGKIMMIAILAAAFMVIAPILGVLGGAFCGWVVGWFFPQTMLTFFAALGLKGLALWQIGAALGFVAGFFRTVTSGNK